MVLEGIEISVGPDFDIDEIRVSFVEVGFRVLLVTGAIDVEIISVDDIMGKSVVFEDGTLLGAVISAAEVILVDLVISAAEVTLVDLVISTVEVIFLDVLVTRDFGDVELIWLVELIVTVELTYASVFFKT